MTNDSTAGQKAGTVLRSELDELLDTFETPWQDWPGRGEDEGDEAEDET
jgi:hypothetical protein